MNQKITIISSFAEDRIIYKESDKEEIKEGGPALWLTKTLKDLGIDFDILTGKDKAKIDVVVENGDERGYIQSVSPILVESDIQSDVFLISTLDTEFDLEQISKLEGLIALDPQGYIRKIRNEDKDTLFNIDNTLASKVDIIKVNKTEYSLSDKDLLEDQKKRILIITRDSDGCEIWEKGKKHKFPTRKVDPIDTLGAGDSFFASFVAKYSKTKDIAIAASFATDYTVRFLENKKA